MSDKSTTPASPPQKQPDQPLDKPKIQVEAVPKDPKNPIHIEHKEKIEKHVTEKVKEALEKEKSGGWRKQTDGAEQVADDAKKHVDPNKVKKVRVRVEGEVSPDGDKVVREKVVVPKGG